MSSINTAHALLSLAARLKALKTTYHALHVNASGPDFYSDHLLFERLYKDEELDEAIDQLLERALILEPTLILDPAHLLQEATSFAPAIGKMTPSERMKEVAAMEMSIQSQISNMLHKAETEGTNLRMALLSAGVENMLQGIADHRQVQLYLLVRRFTHH